MVALVRGLPRSGRTNERVQMSRNLMLTTGALLWGVVAVQAIVHAVTGYWAANVMVAIAGVSWITLRRARWSPVRAK